MIVSVDPEHQGRGLGTALVEDGLQRADESCCPSYLEPVMDIWREKATNVTGKAMPSGHFLPEEIPDETLAALLPFLA